ncbi:MAG: PLP-dependent transferase [Bacteroidaceae bacterium]|nr:PLP-dependent transferase [Bacteroidaceae bacterium]
MKKQTQAIHTSYHRPDPYGALSVPIYHAVAYEFPDAQEMSDAFCGRIDAPDYSRVENPTVTHFEHRVKALTGAEDVIAFNSGMAAISNAMMALTQSGRKLLSSRHLFGNTFSLLTQTLSRFGVGTKLCDLTDLEAVRQAVDDSVCCIFLEIVTNPQLEVADLKALAAVARERGIPLVADTTAIPFTQFSAKELGVDIEIVSSTKYISGGATSLGGLIIDYGRFPAFRQRIRFEMLFNLGAYMTPQAAYMQTLGLETLDARYRVQAQNAQTLAERLTTLEPIRHVNYIGLPTNAYYSLAREQFGPTSGAMLTIELADREACFRFINRLQLIHRATNLFDNRTLAIHPASTIFGNFPPHQRARMGVSDSVVRISVGLEAVDDLFADIRQALS